MKSASEAQNSAVQRLDCVGFLFKRWRGVYTGGAHVCIEQ